jgi:hypothetical protein
MKYGKAIRDSHKLVLFKHAGYAQEYILIHCDRLVLQVTIGILANLTTISPGMNLGYSAVAVPAMQSANHTVTITDEEASWIGKVFAFYL